MQKYEYKFVEVPSTPDHCTGGQRRIAQRLAVKTDYRAKADGDGCAQFSGGAGKGSRQRTVCKITGSDERPIFES